MAHTPRRKPRLCDLCGGGLTRADKSDVHASCVADAANRAAVFAVLRAEMPERFRPRTGCDGTGIVREIGVSPLEYTQKFLAMWAAGELQIYFVRGY